MIDDDVPELDREGDAHAESEKKKMEICMNIEYLRDTIFTISYV